jgi:hypothetical protein
MRTVQWMVAFMMLFHVRPLHKWKRVCLQLCLLCVRSLQRDPSIYSLTGSSKQYCQRPLSVFQCTIASSKRPESTLSVRYKLSRMGFVLMVPLLVLAVSLRGSVQLRRSRLCNPCNTLLLLLLLLLRRSRTGCVPPWLGSVAT